MFEQRYTNRFEEKTKEERDKSLLQLVMDNEVLWHGLLHEWDDLPDDTERTEALIKKILEQIEEE